MKIFHDGDAPGEGVRCFTNPTDYVDYNVESYTQSQGIDEEGNTVTNYVLTLVEE